jgi:ribosomal protein S6--L-glutamate ligase
MNKLPHKDIIGWREWVGFPDLNLPLIKAKIDTGARSSALHAINIRTYVSKGGRQRAKFQVHPCQGDNNFLIDCVADIVDLRIVKSSSGHQEKRITISTVVRLGTCDWPIEVTLTNRDQMGFRVLIGRTALLGKYLVDPQKSFLLGKRKRQ